MNLVIPDEVVDAITLPPHEKLGRLRLELACALYAQELISFGKAAELSGKSQFLFGHELNSRSIPRHYTKEDVLQDLDESC